MSISPKLRDMHKLGADSCDPEFLDALLVAADEIERLRAALEELATLGEQGMKPQYSEWLTFHEKVAKVARDAIRSHQQRTNND
jgi:hypothetical protein